MAKFKVYEVGIGQIVANHDTSEGVLISTSVTDPSDFGSIYAQALFCKIFSHIAGVDKIYLSAGTTPSHAQDWFNHWRSLGTQTCKKRRKK